jgi:retron-type reverse transcriptase
MSKLERLVTINKLSQKDKKWVHKDIFRILNKDEIWLIAYEKLNSNQGALTSGSTPETMDGMSMGRLKRLKEQVLCERYTFKAVKLTYIPRRQKRPLGPTANDKIVQEVIRLILEAIYEPVFSELGFGLCRGCHDALNHVENRFRWVDYVIQGDIEQAYATINHPIFINILEKRIEDPRFIRLIWKLLRCSVVSEEPGIGLKKGVPQGSIVSPILANIYYHELDEFVHKIMVNTSTAKYRKNLKSSAYKSIEHKISKVRKEMPTHEPHCSARQKFAKKIKALRKERLETPWLKNKIIRIEYVRYAYHWMIGISGHKKLAFKVKDEIDIFMKHTLDQKLNLSKTKVTDLRVGNVNFLAYEIFLPRNRPMSFSKGKAVKTIHRGQPMLRFDIPVAEVTKRLSDKGYLKPLKKAIRPISKASYTVLEDQVIVSHYRSLWLGILNYYSGCTNRGRLQYIHYLLHMSCAMTLGHRHKMSCTKIFKKHGKELKIKIPDTEKTISFPYKTKWGLNEKKWQVKKYH